ncbi:MAG: putative RDD family membrane protein YckC [Rhodothermales bacterium]|jgi:uncharacterized RDD family membrane protein YckC
MASTMEYFIRSAEGLEYGPADEATLVQWAKDGRITSSCEIRNSLMGKWHLANEVPFLKDYARVVEAKKDAKLGDKVAKFMNPTEALQETKQNASHSLNKAGIFKYTPGTAGLRALAGTFDTIIVAVIAAVMFAVCNKFIAPSDQQMAYLVFTVSTLALVLVYFGFTLGFYAQTVGQYFWGLMVLRKGGGPVLLGRAMMFTLFMIPLGLTTPILAYCTRSRRAFQDLLSGVIVSRTRHFD